MPYEIYKVLHLVGILMVFVALGGTAMHVASGGTKGGPFHRTAMLTHGLGALLIFVAGFGLMARLGITGSWPAWVFIKLAIWLILGGLIGVIHRKPATAKALWWVILLLGAAAAFTAIQKPFMG